MSKKDLILVKKNNTKPYSFRLEISKMTAIEKWCGDTVRLSSFVKVAIGDAMVKYKIKEKK